MEPPDPGSPRRGATLARLDPPRVGRRFVTLYALSYAGGSLLFLGPLLVSLALKVNDLVGIDDAPKNLALVTGVGSLLAIVSNPLFGRLSDRTTSPLGMRRPWMLVGLTGGAVGTLTVALAPDIGVVLVGWCIAQVFLNALLAAQAAVLPDQVPATQRGLVSGILGVCLPVASVAATYLVQAFEGLPLMTFLAPLLVGGVFVTIFTSTLADRRLDVADKPPWSLRQLLRTFYVSPRANPDFAWAFTSRFMLVMAYAFLVTYQAYYLIDQVGVAQSEAAHQIYLGTLAQSVALIIASPLTGRLSDRLQRRKIFVMAAAVIYAAALVIIATANGTGGYLLGMAIGGLGFGMYMAVDLALVVDVLPDAGSAAKDLGVLNIAGALPFALAPALAPAILSIRGNSYSALYLVAGLCAFLGAAAIVPIRRVT
ncbi:MFS transporter [Terrabacter sp. 2YAF2]|uniref:MFS transporter n=1 Tax=Terrabacter sp. 2YAF2 TaxID=3233026 RepID=UPI003F980D4F